MFEKIRNTLIATSVLYLICGIIMLFFPKNVITFACYLVGIIFIFVALSGIVMYLKTEIKTAFNSFTLVMSIIFGAFGVYVLLNPETLPAEWAIPKKDWLPTRARSHRASYKPDNFASSDHPDRAGVGRHEVRREPRATFAQLPAIADPPPTGS